VVRIVGHARRRMLTNVDGNRSASGRVPGNANLVEELMAADYVFWTAIVLMTASSIYLAPRIAQDRIAMQWGFDGKPTWYAPKPMGLWGLIAFALAIRTLIWAAMTWAPHIVHGADLGVMMMSAIILVSHLFVLLRAAKGG
jgi:Protein of unknown function (DUF1648)